MKTLNGNDHKKRFPTGAFGVVTVLMFFCLMDYPGCNPGTFSEGTLSPIVDPPPDGCAEVDYAFDTTPYFRLSDLTSPRFTIEAGAEAEAFRANGLDIDPHSGYITGTPAEAGEFQIKVRATDSTDPENWSEHELTIRIAEFNIITPDIPGVTCTGRDFTAPIEICGGTTDQDFSWTIRHYSPSPFPLRFRSDVTRRRSNTLMPTGPLPAGYYTFTVTVSQGEGEDALEASQNYRFRVTDELTILTPAALPVGTVGDDSYSVPLRACGGTPEYTWADPEGTLPGWLALFGDELRGIPAAAGAYGFTLKVSDDAEPEATETRSFTLVVREPITASVTTIMTTECDDVEDLAPRCFLAAGGIGELRYGEVIAPGEDSKLPPGLTLDASGCLHGTPRLADFYELEVQITDAAGDSEVVPVTVAVIARPGDDGRLAVERMRMLDFTDPGYEPNAIDLTAEIDWVKLDFHFNDPGWESDWNGDADCFDENRQARLTVLGLCEDDGITTRVINPLDAPCCNPGNPEYPCLDYLCQPEPIGDDDAGPDPLLYFAMDDFRGLIGRAQDQGLHSPYRFRLALSVTCDKNHDGLPDPSDPLYQSTLPMSVNGE